MKKGHVLTISTVILILFSPINFANNRNQSLFQVATFTSLLQGVYDGDYSFSKLAKHGNFGLGTFDATNGEMVAINGKFYQISQNGRAHVVKPSQMTPFAEVVDFTTKPQMHLSNVASSKKLTNILGLAIKNKNIPYAIRITGTFNFVKLRSLTKQKRPYHPLNKTYQTQVEYTLKNVKGTVIGFWFPEYLGKINVPGFHFHFITKDRSVGGHALNINLSKASVAIQPMYSIQINMPKTVEFAHADLNGNHEKMIRKIEGASVNLEK